MLQFAELTHPLPPSLLAGRGNQRGRVKDYLKRSLLLDIY